MGVTWTDIPFGCTVGNVLKMEVIDTEKLVLKLLVYFCLEKTTPTPRIVAEEMNAVW